MMYICSCRLQISYFIKITKCSRLYFILFYFIFCCKKIHIVETINGKEGTSSHLVTIPPGPHLSDALVTSPIIQVGVRRHQEVETKQNKRFFKCAEIFLCYFDKEWPGTKNTNNFCNFGKFSKLLSRARKGVLPRPLEVPGTNSALIPMTTQSWLWPSGQFSGQHIIPAVSSI